MTPIKSKHTPGPWKVEKRMAGPAIISTTTGETVVFAADGIGGNVNANARLIAACPMMYQYIQSIALRGDKDAKKIIATI